MTFEWNKFYSRMWLWKYRLGLNVLIINKLINSIIRLFFQHIYSFTSNLIPKTGQHFINICKFTCKNVIQNILLYTYATCVMYFTWDLEIYSSQSNIYRYAIFYHACGNITLLWWVPLVLKTIGSDNGLAHNWCKAIICMKKMFENYYPCFSKESGLKKKVNLDV